MVASNLGRQAADSCLWCGKTAYVFSETSETKQPEYIKSYRRLALGLFYCKINVQTQPQGAKISKVRTQTNGSLWRRICCIEWYG